MKLAAHVAFFNETSIDCAAFDFRRIARRLAPGRPGGGAPSTLRARGNPDNDWLLRYAVRVLQNSLTARVDFDAAVAAYVHANLPLAPVPGAPEIRLHRPHSASRLGRWLSDMGASERSPYWAYPWAGGVALARYLLDRPAIVTNKRVLDLGAGGGVVAIAAAKGGAREVVAAEIDQIARVALRLNAGANGVKVSVIGDDLTSIAPIDVDVIAVGDLFYEDDLARRVTETLDRYVEAGALALVGDPGRAPLPKDRLALLAFYQLPDFGDDPRTGARRSGIYAWRNVAGFSASG